MGGFDMKNILKYSVLASVLVLALACTKEFEKINAKKVSCLKSETATMELNLARVGKEGDVNHDNEVNAVDLTTLIDILLEK